VLDEEMMNTVDVYASLSRCFELSIVLSQCLLDDSRDIQPHNKFVSLITIAATVLSDTCCLRVCLFVNSITKSYGWFSLNFGNR